MAQEDPIDALFALSPEDFTAARDALAKRLKAEGDGETARHVKQLRRPSVAAWAVDQLARAAPEDLQRLLDTGDALRRAQRAALSGAGGGRLREATAQRRALLDALTERAARLLTDAGRSPDPHRSAIAATLEAATVDDEAAELVQTGRLSRELPPPSGFGDLSGLTLVPDADDDDRAAEPAAAQAEAEPVDEEPVAEEHVDDEPTARAAADATAGTSARAQAKGHARSSGKPKTKAKASPEPADATHDEAEERAAAAEEEEQAAVERERTAREAAAARREADEAEEAAAKAEEVAAQARERADATTEVVRDLERQLAEARRERDAAERAAVDAESAAYRAHRVATDAAKVADRARAATARAG